MTYIVILTHLPPWLSKSYNELLLKAGYLPFRIEEAREIFRSESPIASLILSRLSKRGWLERWDRGKYRIVHPVICLLEAHGYEWRSKIPQRDRLPLLELVVARFFEDLTNNLIAILLFGSLARGEARRESDIDILLVAEGLQDSYSDRIKYISSVLSWKPIEDWLIYLWQQHRIYPNFEIIPLTPTEASVTHPFYIDLTEKGVSLYDKDSFMARKIEEVKKKLQSIGALEVKLPDGGWYWVLAPSSSKARELVL